MPRTRAVVVLIAAVLMQIGPALADEMVMGSQATGPPPPNPFGSPESYLFGSYPGPQPYGPATGVEAAFSGMPGPDHGAVFSQAAWRGVEPANFLDHPAPLHAPSQYGPGSRSRDYPTFNWSGFVQVDSGWFIQDDANMATVGELGNRTGLRRVRLRAYGHTRRTTTYVVDLDFAASGHPSFRDVALSFHEIPLLQTVDFGYFQQPFSLDAMTSGQQLLFLERRLPFAFAPFRQTGLETVGTYLNDRVRWATSVYRSPTDEFGRSVGSSGGFAVASRVTCLPWYRDDGRRLVHLGVGFSMGDPGNNLVRYQVEPSFFETDSGGPAFVDTGDILSDIYHLFNAELAANLGAIHLQSEVTLALVDQRGGPTVGFSGAYAQIGYYLTGESRPYDKRQGVFEQAQSVRDLSRRGQGHGLGAVEIAAGWSYIDLNDKNVLGGKMNEYSLSLNWYPNSLTKLMANLTHAFLDDPDFGPSEAIIPGVRAQFQF